MTDTPREDYEIACEDAARELVKYMDRLSEVSFEYSEADEWGEDDPDHWYWSGTMKLKFESPVPGEQYRFYLVPVYCESESPSNIEFGQSSDEPWGDTQADLWRAMWVEELTERMPEAVNAAEQKAAVELERARETIQAQERALDEAVAAMQDVIDYRHVGRSSAKKWLDAYRENLPTKEQSK